MEYEYKFNEFFREEVYHSSPSPIITGLMGSTTVNTLNREASCVSFVLMHALSQGHTLDEIKSMSAEQRLALGDETVAFLKEHPVTGASVHEGEERDSLKAYGELYAKAAQQFLKEPWPAFDPAHPENTSEAVQARSVLMRTLAIDYSQTRERLAKKMPFIESFGGVDNMENWDMQMQKSGEFLKLTTDVLEYTVPGARTPDPQRDAGSKYLMEHYANGLRAANGRSLQDAIHVLAPNDTELQIQAEQATMSTMAITASASARALFMAGQGKLFTPEQEKEFKQTVKTNFTYAQTHLKTQYGARRKQYDEYMRQENWYKETEAKTRAVNYQENRYMWQRGGLAANLVIDGGKVATHTALEALQCQNELPFVAEPNQAAASFVVNCINRLSKVASDENVRHLTLLNMEKELASGKGTGAQIAPDEESRQKLLSSIQERIVRAREPLTMASREQDMLPVLYGLFDNITGKTAINALESFRSLPEDVQNRVRQGLEEELARQTNPELRALGVDGLLNITPLPSRVPPSVAMNFTDNLEIDANQLAAHMAKPAKLTNMERDYGAAVFDQTFASLYTKQQEEMQQLAGIDPFDMITIDGKSVREFCGDKYAGLDPLMQKQMMKCEVTNAALNSAGKIAFSLIRETDDHHFTMDPAIAVTREGNLHQPKPTFGQRFLRTLRIRQIETLDQKWSKANALAEESRERGDRALQEKRVFFDHAMRGARMNRMSALFRGPQRIHEDIKELTGYPFDTFSKLNTAKPPVSSEIQKQRDELKGYCTLAGSRSGQRPTSVLSVLYGQMLHKGFSLAEILDPTQRAEEKKQIAKETNERMKTPEGLGAVLAESTTAYAALDPKKEIGTLVGHEIRTEEDMRLALTNPMYTSLTLPALSFLQSNSRELQQIVFGYHSPQIYLDHPLNPEERRNAAHRVTVPAKDGSGPVEVVDEASFAVLNSYMDHMDAEGLKASYNMIQFNMVLGSNNNLTNYSKGVTSSLEQYPDRNDPNPTSATIEQMAESTAIMRDIITDISKANHLGDIQCRADAIHASAERTSVINSMNRDELESYIHDVECFQPETARLQDKILPPKAPHVQPVQTAPEAGAVSKSSQKPASSRRISLQELTKQESGIKKDAPVSLASHKQSPTAAVTQENGPKQRKAGR